MNKVPQIAILFLLFWVLIGGRIYFSALRRNGYDEDFNQTPCSNPYCHHPRLEHRVAHTRHARPRHYCTRPDCYCGRFR